MWAQNSKDDRLRCGDRNSKFFHMTTLMIRDINKIVSIKDGLDIWVKEHKNTDTVSNNFFFLICSTLF